MMEQLPKDGSNLRRHTSRRARSWRHWMKLFLNRKERRDAKRDPENAQKKHRYFGWD